MNTLPTPQPLLSPSGWTVYIVCVAVVAALAPLLNLMLPVYFKFLRCV